MAVAVIFVVALLAAIAVVLVASNYRVREAHRQGDMRAALAARDAEAHASEATYERDLLLETHLYTEADLAEARQQAVTRSRAVVSGKVQEHLAPLFPEFMAQFNPREARFIGTPIDYVIFNGLDEGECEIVLVEVKTGRSQLSQRERRVRWASRMIGFGGWSCVSLKKSPA
jgi:predicted Holliday junction resolvase-like endonuclease